MPSWTLTPTQNAIILEVTKILLSNLILYLLLTFWWFLGDYNSKVWTDTYITEQILRIIPHQGFDGYKRWISIISRVVYLGSIILSAFFVTIMTKVTTSSTSVQGRSPISLTLAYTLNETVPSFSLQTLEANNMSFPLAMCRLHNSCSAHDPSGIQVYYAPVGDNVSFIPAFQGLFVNTSVDAPREPSNESMGTLIGFNWNLADMDPDKTSFTAFSTVCMRGVGLLPNSTIMPDSNTVIMEYNAPFGSPPIVGNVARVTGDLGCYLSKPVVYRNETRPDGRNGGYDLERLWPSSTTLASGFSFINEVATVSSEIFPVADVDGRALRLDIVTTQQSFVTFSNASAQPYAGTSKYMSAECNDLLKTLYKSDMAVLNNRTARVYLKRQQDESVVMDACSVLPAGHYDRFYWVHVIVNTSWTTTNYNIKYNISVKFAGLPGIGGVTDKGREGSFPVSNLMLFDYSVVPDQTGDLNSTSLTRLDQTIDKYLQALQKLHYNNDTVWGIRMGVFEMATHQYSMVGATRIELPYVIIVVTLGCLGVLATLLKKILLDKYYDDSFPINIARAVIYQQKNGDSDNSINEAEYLYSLVQLDPSSEKSFSIQLNNRILSAECYSSMSI